MILAQLEHNHAAASYITVGFTYWASSSDNWGRALWGHYSVSKRRWRNISKIEGYRQSHMGKEV